MKNNKLLKTIKNYLLSFLVPISIYLIAYILIPERVGNINNIMSIITLSVLPTITAYGVYFGFVSGIMDFSIGSRIILTGICACVGAYYYGFVGMLVAAIISSLILSLIVGGVFATLKIPSIIVSFGTLMVFEIVSELLCKEVNKVNPVLSKPTYFQMPDQFTFLGKTPYNYIVLIVVTILFEVLKNRTKLANQANVVGSNEIIARSIGIKPMKVKFGTFILGGLFIALAAIQSACYSSAVGYKISMSSSAMVFKPMMAVIIGLALSANIRTSVGIFIGSLCISVIFTSIIALGLSDAVQNIILGGFMIIVMGLPSIKQFIVDFKRRNKAKKDMQNI